MGKIQYWYKSQLEDAYEEVTKQISVQASGSESINELPGGFELTIEPYKKDGSGVTVLSDIDINIGDDFLITEDLINFIAAGTVFDPGRDMIKFDRVLDQAICQFNVTCIQEDFSSSPIDTINFTQANVSTILDEIMLYTDESIGVETIGKYLLDFDDYEVDAFSVEKKTAREALTEFCEQIDCFWTLKYQITTDPVANYIIKRYIEISGKTGIPAPDGSTWQTIGINNTTVKNGFITNPDEDLRPRRPIVQAEDSEYDLQVDASVMINYLDISCKVYEQDTDSILTRYDHPAEPGKFDYEIDAYAGDIPYVAQLVNTKVLTGTTSSSVRIPSRYAGNDIIEAGDTAYFKDSAYSQLIPANLYTVNSVTVVNTTYAEIGFSPALPFTPATGSTFEIVGNREIFRTENEVNYASKGCLIDVDKKSYGKVKFTDLAEPPVGTIITFLYTKVVDYTLRLKNDESIQTHGLKYKEIKLDDDVILTRAELEPLSSKLLILKPVYKLTVPTRRWGFASVGMSMTVNITNFIQETLILNENEWEISGYDNFNKKPIILQTLTFSTYVGDPERILKRLTRLKKKTSSSGNTDEKNKQFEYLQVQEKVTYTITDRNAPPIPENLTSDGIIPDPDFPGYYVFTVTWDVDGTGETTNYRVDVATDSAFTVFVSGYKNVSTITNSVYVNGSSIDVDQTYYVRVRSVNWHQYNATSDNSVVLEVTKAELSGLIGKYLFTADATDSSGNGNDATLENGASVSDGALILDGVDNRLGLPSAIYDLLNSNNYVTICMWVNFDDLSGHDFNPLTNIAFGSIAYKKSTTRFYGISSGKAVTANLNSETWYFVAVIYGKDSTWYYRYINYDGDTTDSWTAVSAAVSYLRLGFYTSSGTDYSMLGKMDTVRIFNRELSDAEITEVKDMGR